MRPLLAVQSLATCGALAACLLAACSPSSPAGVYRIPVQVGEDAVELRTFIVANEPRTLVLYDGRDGSLFGRGLASPGWGMQVQPHEFDVPRDRPLLLVVRDGLIEDVGERPYRRLPMKPLDPEGNTLSRIRLVSGNESRTFFSVADQLYAEKAEAQPEGAAPPNPLIVLNSVAGQGLSFLPQGAGPEWRDAMSTAVPFDPTQALPCGAPLVSVYRRSDPERVQVPAGEFEAIRITEIVDACQTDAPMEVKVFRVERWFVPGLGPVKLSFESAEGGRSEFRLLESNVSSNPSMLWPLEAGNRWLFEVEDGARNLLDPVEVQVDDVRSISAP